MSSAPVAFSHVGLFVNDLDRMVAFYTDLLGFVVSDRDIADNGAEFAFLTGDPREHHQLVLATGRPATVPFNPVQQISFRAKSLALLRRLYRKAKAQPITELGPVSHGNAISAYFRDPEGNRFEIFIDTPWHVPQPMRIDLDLAVSDEELWQRVEEHARRQPGFQPRPDWQADIARKLAAANTDTTP